VRARNLILETEHPAVGTVRFPGFPYKLSQTQADVRRPPPRLGEHSLEVLVELLDYAAGDVAALQECGII
jgi:crotonobetainyl-CoA:carnitine CoA-transferase CaiB-like acyl-CoA transferase